MHRTWRFRNLISAAIFLDLHPNAFRILGFLVIWNGGPTTQWNVNIFALEKHLNLPEEYEYMFHPNFHCTHT